MAQSHGDSVSCICGGMRFPKLPELELPRGALKCSRCPERISLSPERMRAESKRSVEEIEE